MYIRERFKRISEYLKEHKKASVEELSAFLYVSPATVRRDLVEMQALGMVARTHGGALYIEESDETSIFVRLGKNSREKEVTGYIALQHMPPLPVCLHRQFLHLPLARQKNGPHA